MKSPEEHLAHELLGAVAQDLDVLLFLLEVEPGDRLRFIAATGDAATMAGANGKAVGALVQDVLPPDAAASLQRRAELALRTGETQRWVSREEWPLGYRVFHLTVAPLEGGRRIAGVAHDMTSHDDHLARTRRRDDMNRSILDGLPAEVALIDIDGRISAQNAGWLKREVARSNPTGVGDDFLADQPAAVVEGVRAVLSGSLPLFQIDIEEDDRWTALRAAPIGAHGSYGAVLARVDISDRLRDRSSFAQLRRSWEETFFASPIAMVVTDGDGRIVRVNERACEFFRAAPEQLLGTSMIHYYLPEDRSQAIDNGRRILTEGAYIPAVHFRHLRLDGTVAWAQVQATLLRLPGSKPMMHFQMIDITEQKRADERLADYHRLIELVAGGAPVGIVLEEVARTGERHLPGSHWIAYARTEDRTVRSGDAGTLPDGTDHVLASEMVRLLDDPTWRPGRLAPDLERADGRLAATARAHGHRTGWAAAIGSPEDPPRGIVLVLDPPPTADESDRQLVQQLASVARVALDRDEAAARLTRSALEDSLTGLANRSAWFDRLEAARARVRPGGLGFAVLVADLDALRRVNETFGFSAGDAVIVASARRARAAMRPQDVVARAGGDQILVLLEGVADEAQATAAGQRLLEAIRDHDGRYDVTASVGIAVQLTHGLLDDPERNAALAMRLAKARGGDRLEVFSDELRTTGIDQVQREAELRAALAGSQLVVHYQPEIDLRSGDVTAVEALIRWDHPTRGLLAPAEFIGTAEDSGLIVPIGLHVLDESCRQLAEWNRAGRRLTMAVNLSARQLAEPDLVDAVASCLARHAVDGRQLMFEITESTLVEEPDRAAAVLAAVRSLGVRLAIDDFGTGYSSLLYLKRFQVDVLKIDRSFVAGLGTDAGDSAIVTAVLRLAHTLDLTVIAEGVETEQQLSHLRRLGCDAAQGYLWSPPIDPAGVVALLERGFPDLQSARTVHEESEVDDLLAVLTHELSTPLTVIGGYAEMLNRRIGRDTSGEGDGFRSGLSAIERNVDNMSRLVDALVEARGLGTAGEPQPLDLAVFLPIVLDDLGPIVAEHEVELSIDDDDVVVLGDPLGVRQILTNLLGNATKFSPPGTPISVSVGGDGGCVTVTVTDAGPGVPPDREHELFARFSRLGSTRKGLGLGLHLSRLIARRLGGDLRFRRPEHGPDLPPGAAFVLELPRHVRIQDR